MKRNRFLTMLVVACGLACLLGALPASAAFDNLSVSPRTRAMGDAGTATTGGAFAAVQNPAALSRLDMMEASTSYLQPYGLSFVDQYFLGGAIPMKGRMGGIGFGLRMFNVSYDDVDLQKEITFTMAQGLNLYDDVHVIVDVGYAFNLYREEFSQTMGGTAFDPFTGSFTYDDEALDPGSDLALGVDLALMVTLHERTRFAVVARNINGPVIGETSSAVALDGSSVNVHEEALTQRIDAGVAYEPYDGVVTSFELENRIDGELQYHGGLEMALTEHMDLRFGVLTNPNKASAGFSYHYAGASLDYGFSTGGGVLDSSHQFGVSFSWGGEAQ